MLERLFELTGAPSTQGTVFLSLLAEPLETGNNCLSEDNYNTTFNIFIV
jgi:hypothetical protein